MQQFTGVESVRTALFSDDLVTLAIARLYESADGRNADRGAGIFRSLVRAAGWLAIPVDVSSRLKDKPVPAES